MIPIEVLGIKVPQESALVKRVNELFQEFSGFSSKMGDQAIDRELCHIQCGG
jgi:hypothetical protein